MFHACSGLLTGVGLKSDPGFCVSRKLERPDAAPPAPPPTALPRHAAAAAVCVNTLLLRSSSSSLLLRSSPDPRPAASSTTALLPSWRSRTCWRGSSWLTSPRDSRGRPPGGAPRVYLNERQCDVLTTLYKVMITLNTGKSCRYCGRNFEPSQS